MALKGTPAERRAQKEQRRQQNRAEFVKARAETVVQHGRGGHQLVVVACNAALAASKRINDGARRRLANAIARVVEEHDTAENRKETP